MRKKKKTQEVVNNPPEFAVPFLQSSLQAGQDAFDSPNSLVPGFAPQTSAGINLLSQRALGGSSLDRDAAGSLSNILQGNIPGFGQLEGAFGGTNPFLSQFQGFGGVNPALGFASDFAQGGGPGSSQLFRTASGEFLDPNTNPFLQGTFDTAAGNVSDRVNSLFGGAGRFGSGANQQLLTRNLGELANNIFGQNFQQERSRQLQAADILGSRGLQGAGLLGQLGASDAARQLQALQSGAQVAGQDLSRNAQIAQSLGALNLGFGENQLRAAALAPSISNQDFSNINQLLRGGGILEQRERELRGEPFTRAGLFSNIVAANPINNFGTSGQFGFSNPLAGALGGASAGSVFGLPGTVIGGVLGGLF